MHSVFQEITQTAITRMREALRDEQGEVSAEGWDPDAWEQEVQEFTRQLGREFLQVWAEERAEEVRNEAMYCACGRRRHLNKAKRMWWLTTFGKVEVVEPYLVCCEGCGYDRPFQRLTGLHSRGKSRALNRVLTDFGAEKSFGKASEQLWEHYGVKLDRSSVRQVVEEQARRAESFVTTEHGDAIRSYEGQGGIREGEEWLIVESDGSMVRTGQLELDPEGGESPKRHLPKHRRQTQWREVRLTTVERVGEDRRLYGAVMDLPPKVGGQMFALALLMGWGETTQVHGVGDGAPWIAQQMEEVFPRQRYLLDRYHLLEHLYTGASGLPEGLCGSADQWVRRQISAIDRGDVEKVISECRSIEDHSPDHLLEGLARYLENQRDHLDYAWAKERDLPIGSGAVEGGHRHVIQARMKLPGAWWSEEMVNPMLALRTLRVNGWWKDFWN